jgi:hypothetical protein
MFIILLTSLAFSQENRSIKYQKETQIDFEALELSGEMIKPQGSLIVERSNATFNPLIKLRTDWNLEMNQSVNSIK